MKVLCIAPSSTDLKWALLDGTRALPPVLALPTNTQKLPADACEGHALLSLRRLLTTFLPEQGVEHVCVLQAGQSQFLGPSAARAKAEGIIHLVGAELQMTVDPEMIGDLEALQPPNLDPSARVRSFIARGRSGWRWSVEPVSKNTDEWVVRRSRPAAGEFRRWAAARSPSVACRRPMQAAA